MTWEPLFNGAQAVPMLAVTGTGSSAMARRSRSATTSGESGWSTSAMTNSSPPDLPMMAEAAIVGQRLADPDQRGIAGRVARGVVEALEAVQIDHDDHQPAGRGVVAHDQLVGRLVKRASVVQPGQGSRPELRRSTRSVWASDKTPNGRPILSVATIATAAAVR